MKRLRALSSVVDSPDVTAPEQHMRVHDYVSEMLSYNLPIFWPFPCEPLVGRARS